MAKVLILGASGSLGRGIIKELKNTNQILATYANNPFQEVDVWTEKVDITDPSQLESLGTDFDTVVLVAGCMPATMSGYQPRRYIDTNITGTLNVLEYCRKAKIKKLIYIMTFSDVSHKFFSGEPIKSDDSRGLTLTGDHAVYSISKVAACDLIEHYHQEYNLQTITFRIPTVYCADNNFTYCVDGEEKVKGYIKMIHSIVSTQKVELWGDPDNAKDMPYIKDFSRLIELAINHENAQGIFNAGTGKPVSLRNLAETMIDVFSPENPVDIIEKPEKPSQPNFTFDMSKTKSVFGYEPRWDLTSMFLDIRNTLGIEAFRQ